MVAWWAASTVASRDASMAVCSAVHSAGQKAALMAVIWVEKTDASTVVHSAALWVDRMDASMAARKAEYSGARWAVLSVASMEQSWVGQTAAPTAAMWV